jgi:hypothetical protein
VPKRIVRLANRNPFLTSLIMSLAVATAGIIALQYANADNVHRAKVQAIANAKTRADDLAAANLDVCKRAVTAVTTQLNSDLLKIIKTIEDRIIEQGRAVPAIYLQLEDLISNRKPPVATCTPKENP